MFGLGWGEVVVIGIVALIAIGPKELPTVLRTLAQTMGKIRRMAQEFQGQFQEALREAELSDLKKHADDIVSDVTNFDPLADTRKELEDTTRELERSFDMPDPMASDIPAKIETKIETKIEAKGDTKGDTKTEPESAGAALTPATEPLPDGATLPAGTLPSIDIPLPDMPAPLTERDFAPAKPPKDVSEEISKEAQKQAGGKA